MEFKKKQQEKSRQEIEVSLSVEEVQQHEEKALEQFQKELSVQGFRQGHVPKDVVKEKVSQEQVFAKTIELAVQKAYGELVKQEDLQVLGEPEVRIAKAEQGKPLVFSVFVSLFPAVTLPDYKKIAGGVKKKPVEVGPEDIEKTLTWLQESRKKEDGSLPELTDEFVKSLGGFSDVAGLKESVAEGLKKEKDLQERNRVRQEIVTEIAKKAELEVPEVLVQREQQALLEQTKQGVKQMFKQEFADYLKSLKKTEEELKASFAQKAEDRIRQFLVLDAIAKEEAIVPSAKEVEEHVKKVLAQYPDGKTAEKQFDPNELKLYSEGVLKNEKTLELLENLST